MAEVLPEKGDKVSWNWGGGAPAGTVAETKARGELSIKTKRGNTVKKNADPANPAVRIERAGNNVVKRATELTVEEKHPQEAKGDDKTANQGRKRKAAEQAGGDKGGPNKKHEGEKKDEGLSDTEPEDPHIRPHTKNKQGSEVRIGGKQANKTQKRGQNEQIKNESADKAQSPEDTEEDTEEDAEEDSEGDADEEVEVNADGDIETDADDDVEAEADEDVEEDDETEEDVEQRDDGVDVKADDSASGVSGASVSDDDETGEM